MLRSLPAKWFRLWEAYYQLEPWGDELAGWHAASIAQMVHNVAVGGKHQKPLKDFLLKFDQVQEKPLRQSWEQQLALMKIFAAAQNAFVESGQREEHV